MDSVTGNIYFTTWLLATLGFLFLLQPLPCTRNCSYGEQIFSLANLIELKTIQQSTGLRYWFTTIVAMVYYELFSEYLGEMDISCITNCGLGMFDVWLFLWMKEASVNIKKDCLKSILIIMIMKVQVVWSCQMFEYSLQCSTFSD